MDPRPRLPRRGAIAQLVEPVIRNDGVGGMHRLPQTAEHSCKLRILTGDNAVNDPKPCKIELSALVAEAVEKFHDANVERMAKANAADERTEPLSHYTTE